jgi:proline-specific peptidase
VWYRVAGRDRLGTPLLLLHGGPGGGHDYLIPLEPLARARPIVFFDQLGCGRSDKPEDASLWKIERYVREVEAVRKALGLDRIFLYGHSWGGWLAVEYMMSKPAGVVGLILASTSAGAPQFAREVTRLKQKLPARVLATLEKHEATGDLQNPEYEAATMEFYRRHVCRLDPWPEPLMRAMANLMANPVPYVTIQGPNEFTVNGNLKDWDRTGRLGEIRVPTLITVGRHDEITPACATTLKAGIPGSELVIFEKSAHMAMLEETDRYLQVLERFLRESDPGTTGSSSRGRTRRG